MSLSVRSKVALIVTAVMTFAIAALVLTTGYEFQQSYSSALQSRSLAVANSLKIQLERAIGSGARLDEVSGFEEQCREIVKQYEGISYAMVLAPDGRIVFHNEPAQQGGQADPAIRSALKSDAGTVISAQGYKVAILPARAPGGERVASVAVAFPVSLILAKTRGMSTFGLVVGLFFLLVSVSILFFAVAVLVDRPLTHLVNTMEEIRKEGVTAGRRAVVHSRDEIGALASAFNGLMDDLQNTTVSKGKLETLVQERTNELRLAQDELVRKEKLAVLGQLAGSVGHELRNPLGVMNNAVYFLRSVLAESDEKTREYLDIIQDEINNADRIVSDLLDAVRTKTPKRETIAVWELIDMTLRICNVPSSVDIRVEIPETLSPVFVDTLQMQQVFRNLITNGIEAMPGGGTLTIRASEDSEAHTLQVTVTDSGMGLTPEAMSRLFQPLFTTKPRGIGLGLMVVRNLTQANEGRVDVQSEPGRGATFSITLPAAAMGEAEQLSALAKGQ